MFIIVLFIISYATEKEISKMSGGITNQGTECQCYVMKSTVIKTMLQQNTKIQPREAKCEIHFGSGPCMSQID